MRESRKPPSFRKERSPESSDILRAFIICYACSGHAQAPSSSQSLSGHAQALSSLQSVSGHAQAPSSSQSLSGHAQALSSLQSVSGHAQTLSSLQSVSGHARFCHPRRHSQVMQGSVILAVSRIPHPHYRYYVILQIIVSDSYVC